MILAAFTPEMYSIGSDKQDPEVNAAIFNYRIFYRLSKFLSFVAGSASNDASTVAVLVTSS